MSKETLKCPFCDKLFQNKTEITNIGCCMIYYTVLNSDSMSDEYMENIKIEINNIKLKSYDEGYLRCKKEFLESKKELEK